MKHLTYTGPNAGDPICGASWLEKSPGSLHAAYWDPRADGFDFCPGCIAVMEDICPEEIAEARAA